MKDQEIKIDNENIAVNEAAALEVIDLADSVMADAVTDALVPESETSAAIVPAAANKITPGRRMRDTARRGGRGRSAGASSGGDAYRGGSRSGGRGSNRGGENRERVKPEFDSKIIDIRRVTRVTSGGRRMNFSVAVVAGDKKGRVGVGSGKSIDTAGAVEKATREAKKRLIKVPLSAQMIIPHAAEAKYGSAEVKVFPARGRGMIVGSSARAVIEMAGIKDICVKIMTGSKNKVNNAKATIEALKKLIKVSKKEFIKQS